MTASSMDSMTVSVAPQLISPWPADAGYFRSSGSPGPVEQTRAEGYAAGFDDGTEQGRNDMHAEMSKAFSTAITGFNFDDLDLRDRQITEMRSALRDMLDVTLEIFSP